MANELYEVLELTPAATPEEIKRSFYRLVRKHSPERDPDGYKALREAYDTLSDVRGRANYDALQQYGDEIIEFSQQAEEMMEAQLWSDAARLWRRVVALAPHANAAWNGMGLCYLHLGVADQALRVYQALVQREPEAALYWSNLGYAHLAEAELHEAGTAARRSGVKQARAAFERAVEVDPINADSYIAVARTHAELEEYDEALACVEKAVVADGKVDFSDFDALLYSCVVHVRSDRLDRIAETVERIRALVPDDPDARTYVSARFEVMAFDLWELNAFTEAAVMFAAAASLNPDATDAKERAKHCRTVAKAVERAEAFGDESRIIEPLRHLGMRFIGNCFNDDDEEELSEAAAAQEWDQFIGAVLDGLESYSHYAILHSLDIIRYSYRPIHDLNEEAFNHIRELVNEAERAHSYQQGAASVAGPSSECFVVTATYGSPHAPVVCRYRYWRDTVLVRSWSGRLFVQVYRRIGPGLAAFVRRHPGLRPTLALCLESLAHCLPQCPISESR